MSTKIFLVTLSFGVGFGFAQIHTTNPPALLANFIAQGLTLEHVSISDAK